MSDDLQNPQEPDATQQTAPASEPTDGNRVPSTALLRGARSVEIEHHGVVYKLQATRQGKLILTK